MNIRGEWFAVSGAESLPGDEEYALEEQITWEADWSQIVGELPPGIYRVIKTFCVDGEETELSCPFLVRKPDEQN